MQPSEITLAVDALNNATTVDNVFTRFDQYQNRTTYIHSAHSLAARRLLGLYRTFPKVNGNFNGVAKTSFKFTRDVAVAGVDSETTITSPMITEVSFSVPVGVSDAVVLEERQAAIALLDRDDIMVPLNSQQMV